MKTKRMNNICKSFSKLYKDFEILEVNFYNNETYVEVKAFKKSTDTLIWASCSVSGDKSGGDWHYAII